MFRLPSGEIFNHAENAMATIFLILKHGGVKENLPNKLIMEDGFYIEYVDDEQQEVK